MSKFKYTVKNTNLYHDGKLHKIGSTIELDELQGKKLAKVLVKGDEVKTETKTDTKTETKTTKSTKTTAKKSTQKVEEQAETVTETETTANETPTEEATTEADSTLVEGGGVE